MAIWLLMFAFATGGGEPFEGGQYQTPTACHAAARRMQPVLEHQYGTRLSYSCRLTYAQQVAGFKASAARHWSRA